MTITFRTIARAGPFSNKSWTHTLANIILQLYAMYYKWKMKVLSSFSLIWGIPSTLIWTADKQDVQNYIRKRLQGIQEDFFFPLKLWDSVWRLTGAESSCSHVRDGLISREEINTDWERRKSVFVLFGLFIRLVSPDESWEYHTRCDMWSGSRTCLDGGFPGHPYVKLLISCTVDECKKVKVLALRLR